MINFSTIKSCRICNNKDLQKVFDLGEQSLTGTFPKNSQEHITTGPVTLVKCHGEDYCGLVQLKQTYSLSDMYGDNYGYRSGLNSSMVDHLNSIVTKIQYTVNLDDHDIVLDIGSNDATLLKAYSKSKIQKIGIDPSAEKFSHYYPEDTSLIIDFFPSEKLTSLIKEQKIKVISSISMFYDLERPQDFVHSISELLADDGIWYFEQSYLPTMLEKNSFDTICHEHLEFYSLKQITWMLKRAGLEILKVELNQINGGSIAITACKSQSSLLQMQDSQYIDYLIEKEKSLNLDSIEVWSNFSKNIEDNKVRLMQFLESIREKQELLVGLGASTKGNVLLQYFNITSEYIPYILEVNEDKFGKVTPGTHIPIISETEGNALNPKYKLVLPWHFKDFFIEKEKEFLQNGGALVFPLPEFKVYQL